VTATVRTVGPVTAPTPRPSRWSFPLVRIAGIQIRVHATFFLLVALFALAGSAPKGPGVVSSLLWLVVIFACVVFHELAHSIVGRRRGLVVHEIDLLPIGGVSRLESFPETPRDEFAVAIAGPAASVVLGVAAAGAAVATSVALFPVDLVEGPFLARLCWLNLLLAAFNMIPAFPLDGGRVFRSLLERRYDLERSTRIASATGRWFAFVLIASGMVVNLWLAIIGVFVYLGASAEETATLAHVRLAGRRVRDVMLAPPATIDASVSAAELRQIARRNGQDVFPVARAGRYVGVVDAAVLAHAPGDARAGELADLSVPSVAPDDDVEGDLPALSTARGHALVVTDQDRVVGLLRLDDVARLVTGPGTGGSAVGAE
jgi:Zn-dependent protease